MTKIILIIIMIICFGCFVWLGIIYAKLLRILLSGHIENTKVEQIDNW